MTPEADLGARQEFAADDADPGAAKGGEPQSRNDVWHLSRLAADDERSGADRKTHSRVLRWAAGCFSISISQCSMALPTRHTFHVEAARTSPTADVARRLPCRSSAACELNSPIHTPDY